MLDPFDALIRDLNTVRQQRAARSASTRCFEMNPPAIEAEIARCEARFRFRVPGEYRQFLLRVGNGGIGSHHLFTLGEMDYNFDFVAWDDSIGDPSLPFPHPDGWDDTSERLEQLEEQDELLPEQEEEYEAVWEEFIEHYWAPHHINGTIPICHEGCGIRILLIVTGPQAGTLCEDDRANRGGLTPLLSSEGSRLTFFQWYRAWLDRCCKYEQKRLQM